MKQPELLDPIYNMISENLKTAQAEVKHMESEIDRVTQEYREAEPQTGKKKVKRAELFKWKRRIIKGRQKIRYYQLRAESRKIYSRQKYLEAYNKGKPWPDTANSERFETIERLKSASRNWDDRVPRLDDRFERKPAAAK